MRGSVQGIPIDGGTIQTLVSGLDRPLGIATDGTNLYTTNDENLAPLGSVLQVPLDGGAATTLVTGWEATWVPSTPAGCTGSATRRMRAGSICYKIAK